MRALAVAGFIHDALSVTRSARHNCIAVSICPLVSFEMGTDRGTSKQLGAGDLSAKLKSSRDE
jgi:hypothetical protein